MTKKFTKVEYPRELLESKLISIILRFLDQHEATISYEDMSSEIVKNHMAAALSNHLIENGLTMTYMKVTKGDGDKE